MIGGTAAQVVIAGIEAGYGRKQVLHDVSFELRPGVTALLGVNGAGKSTLLRALVGDLRAWSGQVTTGTLGAALVTAPSLPSQNTGYLTQNPSISSALRVEDVVMYAAWLKKMSWTHARPAAESALNAVSLLDQHRERVRTLSGGMRRRLAIAASIVHNPDIVMLDEPTASLDPVQCMEIRALLKDLSGSRVVLISTHLLGDVAFAADNVVILHEGRVRFDDTPQRLAALGGEDSKPGLAETRLEQGFLKVIAADPVGAGTVGDPRESSA